MYSLCLISNTVNERLVSHFQNSVVVAYFSLKNRLVMLFNLFLLLTFLLHSSKVIFSNEMIGTGDYQACWKRGASAPPDFVTALTARPPRFWAPTYNSPPPPDFQTLQHAWWGHTYIKFGHSERPQEFETTTHLIWQLQLSKRQIMWEIVSNFVDFSENPNFNKK